MEGEQITERRKPGWYTDLVKRIDDQSKELQDRVERSVRGALIAFAIIGIFSAGALVGFGFLLKEQGQQADKIQSQRYETIFKSCDDQNERHDNTLAEFAKLEAQAIKRRPKREARIKQSTAATKRLIEALVPRRNCERVAAVAVTEK